MRDLTRTRWAAVGAAVAIVLGAGGVSLSQAAISSGEKPVVVTVDTTRILDTRSGLGLAGGRFVDSTPKDLQVTGTVPVAPSGTATVVPAGAVGVLVNVTVVAPDSKGFLSLRAGGAAGLPTTSTVNFEAGITTPNAATVDLSADGRIQIWLETDNDGGTAHVLLDVVGYTVDHNHDDRYYTRDEVDTALGTKDDVQADVDGGDLSQTIGAAEVLRTVTVETPTSGYVIANSSVRLYASGAQSGARCSITTGSTIDVNAEQVEDAATNQSAMISGTRGYTINKAFPFTGNEITVNLVCQSVGGNPVLRDPYLTAVFVPDPDAFGIIVIPTP